MSLYDKQIVLERVFAETIKGILGRYFFTQTPWADKHEATDFAVFTSKPVKVAARLRRYEYLARYGNEFTIRWSLQSGNQTEIDKIRLGLVDYMLYGFVDESEEKLMQYVICDLGIFRAKEPTPFSVKANTPPDSRLAVYRLNQLPTSFMLKLWKRPI